GDPDVEEGTFVPMPKGPRDCFVSPPTDVVQKGSIGGFVTPLPHDPKDASTSPEA
ncbi:hypothetical protein HYDPIDRAFT_116465, partial [Hydnomerulius pinastri MD-312]